MSEITRTQVCKCEQCGNEAEMVFTCTLPDAETESAGQEPKAAGASRDRVQGHATCSHCGSEADLWIDL